MLVADRDPLRSMKLDAGRVRVLRALGALADIP